MRDRGVYLVVVAAFLLSAAAQAGMNPNNLGFPSVQLFDNAYYDNNAYSVLCTKCHERNPSLTTLDNTGLGSHFVYGGTAAATRTTVPEKIDVWASGAFSKYGKIGEKVSVTGVAGEIICESCHTMKVYTGPARLLAADNATTDPSALCEGCHARTGPGHHILTGETSAIYNRAMQHSLSQDTLFVRAAPLPESGASFPGENMLNCRSCHKPHDAQTKSGARILIRGYRGEGAPSPGSAVQGIGTTGLERQDDVAGSPVNRLVTDFAALCDSCHKTSDIQ